MTTEELLTYVETKTGETVEARLLLRHNAFTTHYFCDHTDETPDLFWHMTQDEEEYILGSEFIELYSKAMWVKED